MGGDGSLNAAVNCIAKNNLPIQLGIIPAGTVNDFATFLGIKNTREAIENYLSSQKTLCVDLASVNQSLFINVAAVGYVADIGFTVSRDHKRIFGRLAYYIKGFIDALLRIQELRSFNVWIDGRYKQVEALMIIVLNSGSLGGFNHFNPFASLSDGQLELYIIKGVKPLKGLMIFLDIMMGKHINHSEIEVYQFKTLSIDAKWTMRMDIDGEKGCMLPVNIQVIEKAIELIIPE